MWLHLYIGEGKMKYCPQCGSPNIQWLLPQDWSKWECKDCGYLGALIIENSDIAEEIRIEYKRNKKKVNIDEDDN
jgi:peptide subunit release factor 1 (eRF1)